MASLEPEDAFMVYDILLDRLNGYACSREGVRGTPRTRTQEMRTCTQQITGGQRTQVNMHFPFRCTSSATGCTWKQVFLNRHPAFHTISHHESWVHSGRHVHVASHTQPARLLRRINGLRPAPPSPRDEPIKSRRCSGIQEELPRMNMATPAAASSTHPHANRVRTWWSGWARRAMLKWVSVVNGC